MIGVRRETRWEVWRPTPTDDGAGGQTLALANVGVVVGDVRELTGAELIEAQQAGAEHTHTGYFHLRADVRRNDELRRGGHRLLVLSGEETFPPTRLRVAAKSTETGG